MKAPLTPNCTQAIPSLEGLFDGDPSLLPGIVREHGVLLLVVFGSTAKGTRGKDSDLDLAVLFPGPLADGEVIRAEDDLTFRIEDDLKPRCRLQVVALNRASELLQKEVADHGMLLYEDAPGRWLWYRIKAYRRYEDTEKYRRRRWEALRLRYGMNTHEPGITAKTESTGRL